MKTSLMGIVASTVLAVSASQGIAATIVIDSFDIYQRVSDVPSGTLTTTSTIGGVGDLGATRTLTVENTAFVGDNGDATDLRSSGGFLSFSNDSGAAGIGTISYSFASTNFLIGDSPYLSFGVDSFDHDTFISISATDADGDVVSYAEALYAGFSPNLSLTSLTGSSTFDWSQVVALQFIANSTNGYTGVTTLDIDGRLSSITLETVPLPATGLLLLGGISGLTVLRRRKKSN